jgi:hypothetical protein
MGKRSWLNDAIANEYLPFLSSLNDDEAGRAKNWLRVFPLEGICLKAPIYLDYNDYR